MLQIGISASDSKGNDSKRHWLFRAAVKQTETLWKFEAAAKQANTTPVSLLAEIAIFGLSKNVFDKLTLLAHIWLALCRALCFLQVSVTTTSHLIKWKSQWGEKMGK